MFLKVINAHRNYEINPGNKRLSIGVCLRESEGKMCPRMILTLNMKGDSKEREHIYYCFYRICLTLCKYSLHLPIQESCILKSAFMHYKFKDNRVSGKNAVLRSDQQ